MQRQIAVERIQHPSLTREQISFYLDQFRSINIEDGDERQLLIDNFVNAVYVYDDKIVLTFNYKNGAKTVKLGDIASSDLEKESPPNENRLS